ncbi:uncharacterized protein TNCV_1064751 [Trichonephila clavipes]|nr:uncharacterized protein TNCV_1064751 [Trichonephila clavipes]
MLLWLTWKENKSVLDKQLKEQLRKDTEYYHNVLKRVIAIVKYLAIRGLAFRGTEEVFDSPHNEILETNGLLLDNGRGQSFDNAANTSGRYNDVQAVPKEKNKFANYVPCTAHSLNLVGAELVKLGLLAVDLVILNHGQVTWTTPELAPPLLTPTPHQREDVSPLDRFNVHRCPTRRVFGGTGLELVTRQATIRYLYHLATADTKEYQNAAKNIKSWFRDRI